MTRGPVHHQQSGQPHSKSAYTYDAEGNILQVDSGQTATYVYDALNRRVRAQTAAATYESLPSNSWTWNYTYDYLNRLWTAIANPATIPEGCQETYDPWGNRTAQTAISGYPCTPASFTVNTNNQLAMPYYDAAGNMTTDVAGSTYTYDAEDRVTSVTGGGSTTNYTYGADGQRVSKQTGADTYYYSYDDDGSVLTRYLSISGGAPTVVNQEVWFAGKHLGTITGVSNQFARDTQDQIGSERLSLDPSGNPYAQMNSLPFGDGLNIKGNPLTPLHFTGKERDPESGDGIATNGNDYLGARYYSSNMGRFLSPDWSKTPQGVPYADLTDPQSLNLYSYVRNNPLSRTDKDGHDLQKLWQDLKAALSETTAKVTIGVGVGGKVKVGPAKARLEIAAKANVSFSNGKASVSQSVEAGATVGIGKTQAGLGASADKVLGSVDLNSGEKTGVEAPTGESVVGLSRGTSSGNGSGEGFAIGGEEGEGALGGGEISITNEGLGDLKSAWNELKDTLSTPAPPPTPTPPAAQPNQ